jgi:hypothetical protein
VKLYRNRLGWVSFLRVRDKLEDIVGIKLEIVQFLRIIGFYNSPSKNSNFIGK